MRCDDTVPDGELRRLRGAQQAGLDARRRLFRFLGSATGVRLAGDLLHGQCERVGAAQRLDGGHHITSYTIMPYIGSVAQSTTTVVSGNPPPVTGIVSGLSNGTAYTFTVTAFTSVGPGPESVKSNAVTPSDAFPYTVVTTQQYEL